MQRINILLAGADRRTGNEVEAMILDVCYEQAVPHIVRTPRVDELIHFGSREHVALVVVLADHLVAEPSRGGSTVANAEVRQAIATIRRQCTTPILAVTMAPENESALREAGADYVSAGRLEASPMRAELTTWLKLVAPGEPAAAERWSLGAWVRGNLRLRSA